VRDWERRTGDGAAAVQERAIAIALYGGMIVPTRSALRFKTVAGLARAFRIWAGDCQARSVPDVDGATLGERRLLAALGGIALAVAEDLVSTWPTTLRRWAEDGPECPAELVEGVRVALGTEHDPLSALYEASITRQHRRRLGTVFTPSTVVDHTLDLATNALDGKEPRSVADAGAGVGVFTVAAARRWPNAHVVAVDVNVVTLGLLAVRIAFEIDAEPDKAQRLSRIELVHGDYLDALGDRFGAGRGRLLCMGNPPYTRIQELPPECRSRATELCGDIVDSGHANLAVLFQAATLNCLRDRDASCMVLPGSIGYTRAARGLRRTIWNSSRPLVVHRTPATTRPFTGSCVQAAIVAIGPVTTKPSPAHIARVSFERRTPQLLEKWEHDRRTGEPDNWFWAPAPTTAKGTSVLSEIAVVRRGVATGANDVFFLTDAVAEKLPRDVVTAAVPTLRHFAEHELDAATHRRWGGAQARRWLLVVPPGYELSGALRKYLAKFEHEVSGRFLPSQRDPWYAITETPRPDLLISPLSKNDFKIVVNIARVVPSNNLFGITMRNGTPPEALAEWLRSKAGQRELLQASRRYHGGSHKLEPGDLKSVRVPAKLTKHRT
jgi:adenine-specific DNA-methyltransferase